MVGTERERLRRWRQEVRDEEREPMSWRAESRDTQFLHLRTAARMRSVGARRCARRYVQESARIRLQDQALGVRYLP